IADRIEAGTYMVAAAAAGGDVLLENAPLEDMQSTAAVLKKMGVEIGREGSAVRIRRPGALKPIDLTTEPHPGFPTDMQAQIMVLSCLAEGTSTIRENIFENRFMHVPELVRMGADIHTEGNHATITGPARLEGANVMATDLRASASLVIAGLVAEGETNVLRVYHLDRGYEHMEEKLAAVGANAVRIHGQPG
ncbi:MAG TPA: UDP-N-acetylglucosamine 1-carboxyvinyltransferase, partial [Polyangiaceae bacterium]|nr:UDP-N-acetylglucosamine 1-carboxyvinyltransferase [Polyangiaceae bacterium]